MFAKGGAGVGSDEEAEANAQKDVFHEEGSECGGVEDVDVNRDGKTGKVAHGGEYVFGAGVGRNVAGLPNVDVDDGEGGRDGPGVNEFAATPSGGVGEDAIRALANPCFDVVAHTMPVKAETDAMEGLEYHEVTTGRAGVEEFEDAVTEGCGWNDEEEAAVCEAEGLVVHQSVFVDPNEVVAEGIAVAGWK